MNVEDNDKDMKAGDVVNAAGVGRDVSAEDIVRNASPWSDMSAVNHVGIEFGASDGDDRVR